MNYDAANIDITNMDSIVPPSEWPGIDNAIGDYRHAQKREREIAEIRKKFAMIKAQVLQRAYPNADVHNGDDGFIVLKRA